MIHDCDFQNIKDLVFMYNFKSQNFGKLKCMDTILFIHCYLFHEITNSLSVIIVIDSYLF
jgi:hypothetical protein